MVDVGPLAEIPSWAVLSVLLASTFYVVRVEPFPAVYGLFGLSIPVQSLVALVVVPLTVVAAYNETYPFVLQYFERE